MGPNFTAILVPPGTGRKRLVDLYRTLAFCEKTDKLNFICGGIENITCPFGLFALLAIVFAGELF